MVDLSNQIIINRAYNGNEGATVFAIAKWVTVIGCVVALILTSAAIRNQILSVQYEVQQLALENKQLVEQNDLFRVELQSLTSPTRVEATARDLGLIKANDDRVLILEGEGFAASQTAIARAGENPKTLHE